MHPSLNRTHVLQCALKDSQRSAHRRLCAHVTQRQVSGVGEASAFLNDLIEQRHQCLAWLFVRQWQQVVTQHTTGHVSITPLAGSNRGVIPFDPHATGLKAAGQVAQSTSIDKLTNKRSA